MSSTLTTLTSNRILNLIITHDSIKVFSKNNNERRKKNGKNWFR
ncbi:hypothetical protein LM900277_100021 [Listeria monocytogenes]|nr:hypothetical protein LM500065_80409 [Listeria monocytogenes]CUL81772.1 hypothetical protein LM900277_100021 [Listeria monocytogenes]